MKIILTGASGFLGSHIARYFKEEAVVKLGRTKGDILACLDQDVPELPVADIVIHAAGKAHMVPRTIDEERDFYAINVQGTQNLLTALSNNIQLPYAFVFISTIAVYGQDTGKLISEEHPLEATDPYGKSKIAAEKVVQEWCNTNDVRCVILRLPLIAGSNPPGNLNAMIKGIKRGYYLNMAGGKARKSMVLASSVPEAILPAIQAGGIYNLTDGDHPSFEELSALIARQLGKSKPMSLSGPIANLIAIFGDMIGKRSPFNRKNYKKMINDLTFDDSKARVKFGWNPDKVTEHFKI
ncbi:Nucleoside-diphosphate-sugar epimerase [Pedobacter westerhofensis]|uniref:Nucleoside-diphosphate-sugar epimerase n=1 Tax=Pedobacter westerhofensis TaxID=425512 RepID=A0A521C929_9SPHI|nr:NAD-dependent epimerase/dehydratase family protein [Pedobacter westerhofensis]SMO55903.1 Nucleoside-diphosphate-sugar epimerase [Pedobacter westerhofensis]